MTHVKAGWLYLITILAEFGVFGLALAFPSTFENFIIVEVVLFGIMIIPYFIFMFATRTSFTEMFGFHVIKFSTFMLTLLYIILIVPMSTFLNSISALFFGNIAESMLTEGVASYSFLSMFLVIAVMGPVIEEMMFRGVMFRVFGKHGRIAGAVIVSALIFGLYHKNLNQFFYTTYIGIMFALIDDAADSIWPSTICHIIFNGFSVCMMYIVGPGMPLAVSDLNLTDQVAGEAMPTQYLIVAYVIFGLISVVFIFLSTLVLHGIRKIEGAKSGSRAKSKSTTGKAGIFSVPLIIGIVIASVVTIINSFAMYLENIL